MQKTKSQGKSTLHATVLHAFENDYITYVSYDAIQEFRLNVLANVDSPQAELLNKIEHENVQKIRWSPCDALATAVLIEPKVKLLKPRHKKSKNSLCLLMNLILFCR